MRDSEKLRRNITFLSKYFKPWPDEIATDTLKPYGVKKIMRGFNNFVLQYGYDNELICLKFFKSSNIEKANTEWQVLKMLSQNRLGSAPEPIAYLTHRGISVIAMEFIHGEQIRDRALTEAEIMSLSKEILKLYSIRRPNSSYKRTVAGAPGVLLERITNWRAKEPISKITELSNLLKKCDKWLATNEVRNLSSITSSVFSKGDPNLENCIWNGESCTFIDFENGGWTSKAYDLADWTEHINARATTDVMWKFFINSFEMKDEEYIEYLTAQKLFSVFWLMKLITTGKRSSQMDQIGRQAERVDSLL